MTDLLNARGKVGGIFKGTRVKITLGQAGGDGSVGALVQQINIRYQRNVSRIWELGSEDTYYVVGHTEGTATLSKILAKVEQDILDSLADACASQNSVLGISSTSNNCDGASKLSIKMSGPVVVGREFAISVQDFMLTSQASMMFAGLEKTAA